MLLRYKFASRTGSAAQCRTWPACGRLRTLGSVAFSLRGTLRLFIGARASGNPAIPDYLPPALTSKLRVREEKIEGMRVDVGGLLIPFKTRGDLVYGFVHTANPLHGMRIGEASNPGPARDWHDVGGVYYGRFDGELQLGIYIKRLGATSADFEYVFAVPTRPAQPGACEARARESLFICGVQFVKLRGTNPPSRPSLELDLLCVGSAG